MIRILHIGFSSNPGGVENFVMNIYKKIDKNKIQFDFLVDHNAPKIAFEDEIKKLGGRVFREYYRRKEFLNPKKVSLKKFFKLHPEIKGVHMHANYLNPMYKVVKVAKKMKLPVRIVHSHNTGYLEKIKFKDKLYEKYNKFFLKKYITKLYACSKNAGEWMFGNNKFYIINNSVDINRFEYKYKDRLYIRKKLKINDENILLGNTSRISYQKNPFFLIDIFERLYKLNKNYRLILVGDGELKEKILNIIKDKKLSKVIKVTGAVNDPEKYLSAMDAFIFPSLFEGFGISLLEAQISGLKCYASKNVPNDVNCTNKVVLLDIDNLEEWVENCYTLNKDYERKINKTAFKLYDIDHQIKIIEKEYLSEVKDEKK